jgi:hypothetical protein
VSAPRAVLLPHVEGLPEFLEACGFRVRLEVQRTDGAPLTDDEQKALALAVESYQASDRTDDELAAAVEVGAPGQDEALARKA